MSQSVNQNIPEILLTVVTTALVNPDLYNTNYYYISQEKFSKSFL